MCVAVVASLKSHCAAQALAGLAVSSRHEAGTKEALAHTLVPPPYVAPMPHPPPAHSLTPASDMALEGKVGWGLARIIHTF